MHIALVCNEIPPASGGGIGQFVLHFSEQLARSGHKVTLIGLYDQDLKWDATSADILAIKPPFPRGPLFRRIDRSLPILLEYLRRRTLNTALRSLNSRCKIDVVEWPDYEGLFLNPIKGVTDVLRTHSALFIHKLVLGSGNPRTEYWEKRTLKQVPNWIGNSSWFLEHISETTQIRPANSQVIFNGIPIKRFHPLPFRQKSNTILYAGTLIPIKGVYSLLRAASEFLPRLPHYRLHLVGRTVPHAPLSEMEALIPNSIRPQISILHPIPQSRLASLMAESRLFAMPSYLESFGNVWAEAMACGTPVLGSTRASGPEVVPTPLAGMLADPDSPSEIANTIVSMLGDEARLEEMGRNAIEYANRHYSMETCARRSLDFYHNAIQRDPNRSSPSKPAVG